MSALTLEPGSTLEVELGHGPSVYRKSDFHPTVAGGAVSASALIAGVNDAWVIGGLEVTETTGGSTASIRLHDGESTGDAVIGRCNLAANETSFVALPGRGVRCISGTVFLEVISGSVEGVIYWLPRHGW